MKWKKNKKTKKTKHHEVFKEKNLKKNYFDNTWKHEHEMKQTRLWYKIVFQTKSNGKSYIY